MSVGEAVFVQFEEAGARVLARVRCEKLGARESQVIEQELKLVGPKSAWKMGVDLTEVQLIASMGLGMLVSIHRMCKDNKGVLALWGVNDELMNVLKLTQLHRVLKIENSREAALRAIA